MDCSRSTGIGRSPHCMQHPSFPCSNYLKPRSQIDLTNAHPSPATTFEIPHEATAGITRKSPIAFVWLGWVNLGFWFVFLLKFSFVPTVDNNTDLVAELTLTTRPRPAAFARSPLPPKPDPSRAPSTSKSPPTTLSTVGQYYAPPSLQVSRKTNAVFTRNVPIAVVWLGWGT